MSEVKNALSRINGRLYTDSKKIKNLKTKKQKLFLPLKKAHTHTHTHTQNKRMKIKCKEHQ